MKKEYFENVKNIGILYLEKVFMKFEDENIIFVCTDENNNRYLGVCYETRLALKWVLCQVTNELMLQVLFGIIPLRTCFEQAGDILLVQYTEADGESSRWDQCVRIESRILPDEDFYLKYSTSEDNYYLVICGSMFEKSRSIGDAYIKADSRLYKDVWNGIKGRDEYNEKVIFHKRNIAGGCYNMSYVENRQYA